MDRDRTVCQTQAVLQFLRTFILKLTSPPACMDPLLLNGAHLNLNSRRQDLPLLRWEPVLIGVVLWHRSEIQVFPRSSSIPMTNATESDRRHNILHNEQLAPGRNP
jgi:hypothetical protein